ncbi:hypothetical protein [Methylosinus sp. Sm6]|uniref:hypothetical protein n=1 Tax=Methylosinus sp. Sm6 TaxID=2866948 RepID=UPI001C98F634|nr:hypothetical protein [Methylosinus sp. Sm6]MBY6239669.1 hypothetical protein [Methylosinus sp. Sm6]
MQVIDNDSFSSGAFSAPSCRGRELASLGAGALGERFYSWRASCGRLYVCSIFSAEEAALIAAFADAAVIGVVRDGASRRPACVFASDALATAAGRRLKADARRLGVTEWHVRFCAGDRDLTRRFARALLS